MHPAGQDLFVYAPWDSQEPIPRFAPRILCEPRANVEYSDMQRRRTTPQDDGPDNISVDEFRSESFALAQVVRSNRLAGPSSSPCRIGSTGVLFACCLRRSPVGGKYTCALPGRDQARSFMALVSGPQRNGPGIAHWRADDSHRIRRRIFRTVLPVPCHVCCSVFFVQGDSRGGDPGCGSTYNFDLVNWTGGCP